MSLPNATNGNRFQQPRVLMELMTLSFFCGYTSSLELQPKYMLIKYIVISNATYTSNNINTAKTK